jgi:signal transduction histidine kinase
VLGAVLLFAASVSVLRFLETRRPAVPEPLDIFMHHWLLGLALFLATTAAAAYPVAKRITARLERLRAHAERLGGGDLAARVPVEGDDEVADLAHSLNRAASRIESLVRAQRALLANVSHELRTPLARLRVGVELLESGGDGQVRRRIVEDVEELDALLSELLLASRLESGAPPETTEEVDLLALLAEEAARCGAEAGGQAVCVRGDPRLLRRLLRNLLENARRHGGGPVECEVRGDGPGEAVIEVRDRGPGVPAEERERIFEPFHRLPGSGEAGAGLGLALVRQIARRHGGEVLCLPREGGGSRFEVRLARG